MEPGDGRGTGCNRAPAAHCFAVGAAALALAPVHSFVVPNPTLSPRRYSQQFEELLDAVGEIVEVAEGFFQEDAALIFLPSD
jgi:hypothetical protein